MKRVQVVQFLKYQKDSMYQFKFYWFLRIESSDNIISQRLTRIYISDL